jgi:hypothetical protein
MEHAAAILVVSGKNKSALFPVSIPITDERF